jgi:5-formyltetrahydrofolate cyclo-ligase
MTDRPVPTKAELRSLALGRRAALDPVFRAHAAEVAAGHAAPLVPAGATVALFASMRGEIDTRPLAELLSAAGHVLALPVVAGRGTPLVFRAWRLDHVLAPGHWRIPEPGADAPILDPDFLFVPLAAFDRAGHRLGYGAGHYDRTLAALHARRNVRAFGLAFGVQEVERLPAEPHDVALDGIVTEAGLLERR